MSTKESALKAYRAALRAMNLTFKGDREVMNAARTKLRNEMRATRSKDHPEMNVKDRIDLLKQVATYLTRNIVQGVKVKEDNTYMLRFHEKTETNKNIPLAKRRKTTLHAGPVTGHGGCCGGKNRG